MSRAGPKFSDAQRETVYRLKSEGKSGRVISELCAAGVGDVAPFKISGQYANELAGKIKRERETLTLTGLAHKPTGEALRVLVARMISIGEREIETLAKDQRAGKMDARDFASVARSLKELQALASKIPDAPPESEPKSPEVEHETPRTFLGGLLEDDAANPATGDVRLPASALASTPPNKAAHAPAQPAAQPPTQPAPQPKTGVAAQIAAAAKVGRRHRARAVHSGTEASEAKHASSEVEKQGNGRSTTNKGTQQGERSGLNGENSERSRGDDIPASVAKVLARRA